MVAQVAEQVAADSRVCDLNPSKDSMEHALKIQTYAGKKHSPKISDMWSRLEGTNETILLTLVQYSSLTTTTDLSADVVQGMQSWPGVKVVPKHYNHKILITKLH